MPRSVRAKGRGGLRKPKNPQNKDIQKKIDERIDDDDILQDDDKLEIIEEEQEDVIVVRVKRKLTPAEILDILSVIKVYGDIPILTKKSVEKKIKDNLSKQLQSVNIYEEAIPGLKKEIRKNYNQSLVQPGESVGILTAQSIGERQTQMTLNTFHSAGLAIATVVTGVPRFSELLNATKDPKSVISQIYFKRGNETIQELRKEINYSIREMTLKLLSQDYSIFEETPEKDWYDIFRIFNPEKPIYKCGISFQLNTDLLFEYSLDMEIIATKIEDEFDDITCICSPNNLGILDVFVDTENIRLPENIIFIDDENMVQVYLEEVVIPNLKDIIICGIPGISDFGFKKDGDKWMIETIGCNFPRLLSHDLIDGTKVTSNNMWNIYNTLGIEAAREFLIDEFMGVVSSDGTYINERHVMLLVDIMTFTGNITSISRYGMKREQTGPLAKASFEESLDNFLKAGVYGEIESTNGVSASIMCGKRSQIGTGLCSIMMDIDALPK